MTQKVLLGVIAACVAVMGAWAFMASGRNATVEARVVSVTERCFLRIERDGKTSYTKLAPCDLAKAAAKVASPAAKAALRTTRAVELAYVAPATGAPASATIAESLVSSSPLKAGDVVRIRAKVGRAGDIAAL